MKANTFKFGYSVIRLNSLSPRHDVKTEEKAAFSAL